MKKIILATLVSVCSLWATAQEANELKTLDEFFEFHSARECSDFITTKSPSMISQKLRKSENLKLKHLKILSLSRCFDNRAEAWENASEIMEKDYIKVEPIDKEFNYSYDTYIMNKDKSVDNEIVMYLKNESVLIVATGNFSYQDVQEYILSIRN